MRRADPGQGHELLEHPASQGAAICAMRRTRPVHERPLPPAPVARAGHGFGRIARLVDAIGHRFTYQEWMTRDIAEALMQYGKARGAACVIEAEQLCLLLGEDRRGDERVITQSFTGEFETSDQLRNEFLRACGGPRRD